MNIKNIIFTVMLLIASMQKSNAQCKDPVLELIGSLSGVHLYNTYLAIGSVGDAFEKKVYEADYVKELLEEQITSLEIISDNYQVAVDSNGFNAIDQVFVTSARECCLLLKAEAEALIAYINDNSVANAEIFQAKRETAWIKIADLLGIEADDD